MSDNARNLAESALETAGLYASKHGIGMNVASPNIDFLLAGAASAGITNCADMDNNMTNGAQPCVGFEVHGRAADAEKVTFDNAQYFSAPIKGSGDAADGVDCSTVPDVDLAEADHPCNWNRMYLGHTVEIPLYYEEADGTIKKLFDPANQGAAEEFRLRVRSQACAVGSSGCSADGRLILYPSVTAAAGGENPDYRNPDRDPVLVQWSVFDAEGNGVVTAWDETAGGKRRMTADRFQNTEISSGRINLANTTNNAEALYNFIVLQHLNEPDEYKKHRGKNSDKQAQTIGSFIATPTVTKPTLRLSLVGQPQRHFSALDFQPFEYPEDLNSREEFDIPYLEYQFLTKESPPSGEKTLIIGWAEIGGFRKEFRKYKKRQTSASGFAIESY